MKPGSALVVGAGIGGLATAVGLQRLGWRVRVIEQANELTEIGAGLTLSPNANRALSWLGVAEQLAPHLSIPPYQIAEDTVTGEEKSRLVRGPTAIAQYGAPYAFVHRADLHAVLARAVAAHDPQVFLLGRTCRSASSEEQAAVIELDDGQRLRANLVIGADGVRSAVRASLLGEMPARYTGFVAWRRLLPLEAVVRDALPAGSAVTWGVGKLFVRYRLEPRRQLNIVSFAKQADWAGESWTIPADPEVPAKLFADWHPALSALWRTPAREPCFQWGLLDREPIAQYDYGNIALLGDAAHPMLPFLGQGAALALEDAVILARTLESGDDLHDSLRRYSLARQPRGAAAQLESRAAGARLHGEGGDPRLVNEETLDYFRYDAAAVEI
ncbi:MAG: FAD-dependent monooxygenase [Proteobacteria bacterium]|nr:FAD-dependent monooxygenase [Pseudomonadota bacterium]